MSEQDVITDMIEAMRRHGGAVLSRSATKAAARVLLEDIGKFTGQFGEVKMWCGSEAQLSTAILNEFARSIGIDLTDTASPGQEAAQGADKDRPEGQEPE